MGRREGQNLPEGGRNNVVGGEREWEGGGFRFRTIPEPPRSRAAPDARKIERVSSCACTVQEIMRHPDALHPGRFVASENHL